MLLTALGLIWSTLACANGGLIILDRLNGGDFVTANDISADGRVVVGWAADGAAGNASRAFRWTAATGMETLNAPNAEDRTWALGISGDGRVAVGVAVGSLPGA